MPGLRQLAESDLAFTLEDDVTGFGVEIEVTDPTGFVATVIGSTNDIEELIDPNTGAAVTGRMVSVVLRMSTLRNLGFAGFPRGVASSGAKPWIIRFSDMDLAGEFQQEVGGGFLLEDGSGTLLLESNQLTWKVNRSMPDRTLGVVVCVLEKYVP